jgi:hypothetical protein
MACSRELSKPGDVTDLGKHKFEKYAVTCAPSRIRTCAHGSGGQCPAPLLPAETSTDALTRERIGGGKGLAHAEIAAMAAASAYLLGTS